MVVLAMKSNDPRDDDERYLVYNRREIAGILRDLAKQREMLTAVFAHGHGMVPTSVVDVDFDRDAVYLDIGPDEVTNRSLLSSERTIFVSSAGGIKIQWISTLIHSVKYDGSQAFKIALPNELQRIQRREYFRLDTPIVNPLICRVPQGNASLLRLPVANISAGGIAVNLTDVPDSVVETGAEFHECKIDLPEIGEIQVDLQVRSIWSVALKNDVLTQRAGMAFTRQRAATPTLIQRYIIKLERDRLAAEKH